MALRSVGRPWGGVVVVLVLLNPGAGRAQEGSQAPAPPAREIPGINAVDRFPGACVDCHVEYPERSLDVRMSTLLAGWTESVDPTLMEWARRSSRPGATLEGRHPEVREEVFSGIPETCVGCHRRRADSAPDMARLIHGMHLLGGEDSVFLTAFQGECTHCHKLDPASGAWTVPSGRERAGAG